MNIIPDNDVERIAALRRYQILDTPPEGSFNNVAALAARIFNVPISLISLVDEQQVFFKANIGMGNAKVTPRGVSLCSLAVLKSEVTVFENAPNEPCLLTNPNVAGSFGLKFYAGAPLTTHDGFRIGTLCVIDKLPRKFSKHDEGVLEGLAKIVIDEIELRLSAITERDKQQHANEELTASNEELLSSQEYLVEVNDSLAASEYRFRSLIDQSPVAIATLKGRELVIDCANAAVLRIWGKDESVLGKPLHIALPELEGQPFLQILDDVFISGKPFYGNEAFVSLAQNGMLMDVYVNFVYHPIIGKNGQTSDIMVVANDVTEQVASRLIVKKKNEELSVLAEQLSYVNNAIPQQVWTATPDGLLDFLNVQGEEYFGKPAVDLIGDKWLEVVHPDDLEAAGKAWSYSLTTGEPYQTEFRLRTENGDYLWHLARAKAYIEGGKIIKWFGTNTNIDGHKRLEQHKDDFIGIASHELKTPITSLKTALQLLDRVKDQQPPSPLLPKMIDQANRGAKKISGLVDDLLSVSRMKEGQVHLNKSTFSVQDLFSDSCEHIVSEGEYKVLIEGDTDARVFADAHLIEQVLINLLNNAVKYAPDSKTIWLKAKQEADGLTIYVTDNGAGIPASKVPHLFDRYYRVDHSGKQYSGLGLGLYISSEIIKRHGGEIGVNSELGMGSTFWFTLPLASATQ